MQHVNMSVQTTEGTSMCGEAGEREREEMRAGHAAPKTENSYGADIVVGHNQ